MARPKKPQPQPQSNDLQVLMANLKPIPFLPLKTQDLSAHESLLKRLGLWDFANLDFDRLGSAVRSDLVAQLIANFDREKRCSVVGGATIPVGCAEMARALKLPEKRGSAGSGMGMVAKESTRFVADFVFDWMVLREKSYEAWIVPKEISDWLGAVKDGKFEEVDWAAMVWFMVESELTRGRELRDCYYATHMMCLINVLNGEEGKNSSELSRSQEYEATIEGQNAVIEALRAVIKEQNAVIEAKTAVIKKQQERVGSYEAKIEEQNAGIGEYKATIEEQRRREGSYKAKIEEQEKEHALMMNLLKAYREALTRNQTAFSEFRESCQCKDLHEPIYKDVPGSSGLVLSARGLRL